MRLATFEHDFCTMIGLVSEHHVTPLDSLGTYPATMRSLIAAGPDVWEALRATDPDKGKRLPLREVHLLAPVPDPPNNVICLGLNYRKHIEESAPALDQDMLDGQDAIFFTKAISSINSPFGAIPYDAAVSTQIDWEVELGVVMGIGGRHIPAETALQHVFGYMVINDISARDVQHRHKQFFLGKSLDGACPTGPFVVTTDEIADPQQLTLRTMVNGELKQEGTTASMIFNVAEIISILSRYLTLKPGDVIATGTPDGIGSARQPPEFLEPGDLVVCEIEGIGTIENRIVASTS